MTNTNMGLLNEYALEAETDMFSAAEVLDDVIRKETLPNSVESTLRAITSLLRYSAERLDDVTESVEEKTTIDRKETA